MWVELLVGSSAAILSGAAGYIIAKRWEKEKFKIYEEQARAKAKIVTYEWGEYLKRTKNGEHMSALLGWTGDNGDPDNFLYVLLSCAASTGANRARWCYEPFDKLLKEAKLTTDIAERTRLYEQAQVVFKEQAPWFTIAHSKVFMPMSQRVKDYKIDPFGGHVFYGVDLK